MKRVFEYLSDNAFDGMPIKSVLRGYYQMSSNLITDLKKHDDGILLNGRHARVTDCIQQGDMLTLTMYDGVSENIVSTPMELSVVYEDEDVILLDKPAGLPTHPSIGNYDNTLANGLMAYWRGKGEERVFRAVNRLDKNTSGIMAVAKNAYSHAQMCKQIQEGRLHRTYLAIVCGETDEAGTIDAPIVRESESIIKRCVRSDGQRAVTHYRRVQRLRGYSLLELELETGRTHQIRVHMAYIGHPLIGDFLYGEETTEFTRQMLHSASISFTHPVNGLPVTFSCGLPEDMKKIIKKYE